MMPGLRFPWRRRAPDRGAAAAVAIATRLIADTGEVAGNRLANELAEALHGLDDAHLRAFLAWADEALSPDAQLLAASAEAYLAQRSREAAAKLCAAAEPRRQELFRRLNTAAGGTALIVDIRARLAGMLAAAPDLEPLDRDLRHLLGAWFNRGFLALRRIDWNTPAAILEKLIAYEAVHEIGDWDALRARLVGNRRCYAFFHPALPGEPLIFVEIALTDSMSAAIAPLLRSAPDEPATPPTTAIFYSISNCQRGLSGISFGNSLIKQISTDLKAEFPSLTTFATLSPVPGFRRWLDSRGGAPADAEPGALSRLCARYLTSGTPRDPVAKFHLTNGARLERINENADLSPRGQAGSLGVMVNYRYLEDQIVTNHEAFVERGEVAVAPSVRALIAAGEGTKPRALRARFGMRV